MTTIYSMIFYGGIVVTLGMLFIYATQRRSINQQAQRELKRFITERQLQISPTQYLVRRQNSFPADRCQRGYSWLLLGVLIGMGGMIQALVSGDTVATLVWSTAVMLGLEVSVWVTPRIRAKHRAQVLAHNAKGEGELFYLARPVLVAASRKNHRWAKAACTLLLALILGLAVAYVLTYY